MLQSKDKLIVVLVDKRTGEIIAHKEIPANKVTRPYHVCVKKTEEELVRENPFATSSPTFFTGMATSFNAFIQGYPEMRMHR